MKKNLPLLLLFLVSVFTAKADIYEITADGLTFSPDDITIQAGDTVRFNSGSLHPVLEVDKDTWETLGKTALDGGFSVSSGNGDVVFNEPGTYYYVCENHVSSGMRGKITVEDSGTGIHNQMDKNKIEHLKVYAISGQEISITNEFKPFYVELEFFDLQGRVYFKQGGYLEKGKNTFSIKVANEILLVSIRSKKSSMTKMIFLP